MSERVARHVNAAKELMTAALEGMNVVDDEGKLVPQLRKILGQLTRSADHLEKALAATVKK